MDAHEIIAQMTADPALLVEIRAVVLSEELLWVPERLTRVVARLEQVEIRLDRLEQPVAALVGALDHASGCSRRAHGPDGHARGAPRPAARGGGRNEAMFGQFMAATVATLERMERKVDGIVVTLDEPAGNSKSTAENSMNTVERWRSTTEGVRGSSNGSAKNSS